MSHNNLDFKAVIVAAGRGQRLDSLTENIPKLLLQFRDGQSILEYTLLSMNEANLFNKVVIVTGIWTAPKICNQLRNILNWWSNIWGSLHWYQRNILTERNTKQEKLMKKLDSVFGTINLMGIKDMNGYRYNFVFV